MTTYINADNGVVSGVAGLKYGADASGALVLQTNGTTAISISAAQAVTFVGAVSFTTASFTNLSYTGTLTGGTGVVNLGTGQFYKDASGNVGIGTSSPGQKFHISAASGSVYQQISSGANNIYFGYVSADAAASIQSNGAITFLSGGSYTERMRIDSSGNVGIGTASPVGVLQVSGVASTNSTSRFVTKLTDTTSVATGNGAGIMFQGIYTGTTPVDGAGIQAYKENSTSGDYSYALTFGTRASGYDLAESLRITSAGTLVLKNGSTSATGIGITFPATQSASSDANTLDDYEEGTWTPTDLSGAGLSFSGGVGTYTKIGRMVYFAFDITFPSTASTASISISLPFNPVNWNTGKITAASIGYQNTGTGIVCSTYHGTNSLLFYNISGSATQNSTMSNREIAVSGCYPTS